MPALWSRHAFAGLCLLALAGTAHAVDTISSPSAPDLGQVRAAIKVRNYKAALADLRVLEPSNPQPDVYSLLGFTLRKTGDRQQAMTYYRKALELDPKHKGALEYQGELFIELGQLDEAKTNLGKLKLLCPSGCEEREDLQEAIEKAQKSKG
jgi:Flp pilus assembly protein TadD